MPTEIFPIYERNYISDCPENHEVPRDPGTPEKETLDPEHTRVSDNTGFSRISGGPSHRGEDLNVKLLNSIIRYTAETYGKSATEKILDQADLSMEDFSGPRYWISHAQFERVLASCRAIFKDDQEFKTACRHKLAESYGPLRYLVRAASMGATFLHAVKTMHLVSHISHYEPLDAGPGRIITKYHSDRSESRLMCLSRISNIEAFATLWGLPLARVEESSCIARGDDACTYHITWNERSRLLPAFLGAILGGVGAAAILIGGGPLSAAIMLPILGGLAMHVRELQRVYQCNVEFSEESNKHLRDLNKGYSDALEETGALTQRHKDWSRLLETRLSRNRRRMEEAFDHMGALLTERQSKSARTTHDMGTPLQILSMLQYSLENHIEPDNKEGLHILNKAVEAADLLSKQARELVETPAKRLAAMIPMKPGRLEVRNLAEHFERRVMAQAAGRNIRVTAFTSPDVPSHIKVDHLLFDLVMDKMLANAVRRTEKGIIKIQVENKAESLAITISDTGSFVEEESFLQLLEFGKTENELNETSAGYGLWMAVDLLDGCGGRLEVISRQKMGTAFRAYFPFEGQEPGKHVGSSDTRREVISRVVTFRKEPSEE